MEIMKKDAYFLNGYSYAITRNKEYNALDDFFGYDGNKKRIIKFLQQLGYAEVAEIKLPAIYYREEKYKPEIELRDNLSTGNRQIKYLLVGEGNRCICESKIWYNQRKRAE